MTSVTSITPFDAFKEFEARHIGPSTSDQKDMLKALGTQSLEELMSKVIPQTLRFKGDFAVATFPEGQTEANALARIKAHAQANKLCKNYIGMGYYGTHTPTVILRNILENPGWYTQYTPYQPEISQGRLEALLNYQTLVAELTGLPIANASLLDEATAAAEAMAMAHAIAAKKKKAANTFWVSERCHPQTIAVVQTRAAALGLVVTLGKEEEFKASDEIFGLLIQYPDTFGTIRDYKKLVAEAHKAGTIVTVVTDLLALVELTPPGEFGADIAVGSAQRFGVPMGYGGPHAAFFSTKDEFKRIIPGRIVGASLDTDGNQALRLALQTREQHIRREKATSNICTAQVLLAIMASMYAVYHGPNGLTRIAKRVNKLTKTLSAALQKRGLTTLSNEYFDTITIVLSDSDLQVVKQVATSRGLNLRYLPALGCGVSLDETTSIDDVAELVELLTGKPCSTLELANGSGSSYGALSRSSKFLQAEVFNRYHSETEFLRYVRRLESRDLSLGTAMIPLGSCTMKLNATSEMIPVTWPEFANLHPFAPVEQAKGYTGLFSELKSALSDITGLPSVSLQPNAGSQGEYAGLLAIKAYLEGKSHQHRTTCLIPRSAHGTNPASAAMAGMSVVVVECDDAGNISVEDLAAKAEQYKETLACLMVTYPSTHGVFEDSIKEITSIIHARGGQVYMDGANLNALVGLVKVADLGADVVHINLHKTFCIPHGGGGPGMGPIAAAAHLAPYLPGHPVVNPEPAEVAGAVSAAPWGSSAILPISWMYMAMMGASGLKTATEVAILNANYIAKKLEHAFPVLYRGQNNFVAHECILDFRGFKKSAGIEVEDVAKRLMDYGFHAPTMSWPVAGTMMIEPTESESKEELDRFISAMLAIRAEIAEIEAGKQPQDDNLLKNAPHTAKMVMSSKWTHPYSREQAAFPTEESQTFKFWPSCRRIDGAYGDKNLVCTCADISEYEGDASQARVAVG